MIGQELLKMVRPPGRMLVSTQPKSVKTYNQIVEKQFVLHRIATRMDAVDSMMISTQQLDFLGNCQCRLSFLDNMHKEARAQVPIFDTTQMGCLSIVVVGTWTLLPFQGLFKT